MDFFILQRKLRNSTRIIFSAKPRLILHTLVFVNSSRFQIGTILSKLNIWKLCMRIARFNPLRVSGHKKSDTF